MAGAGLLADGLLGKFTDEQQEQVENINFAAKELNLQLDDIREVNGLETKATQVKAESFPAAEIIKEIKWLTKYAEREKIKLIIEADPGLTITADKRLTAMILESLLLNAIKQTKRSGRINFSIKPENNNISFAVTDHGEVLPKDFWGQAFDQDFKSKNPQFKTRLGRGFGLYFYKLAVQAQGGKIKLESTVQNGTVVSFTLPKK